MLPLSWPAFFYMLFLSLFILYWRVSRFIFCFSVFFSPWRFDRIKLIIFMEKLFSFRFLKPPSISYCERFFLCVCCYYSAALKSNEIQLNVENATSRKKIHYVYVTIFVFFFSFSTKMDGRQSENKKHFQANEKQIPIHKNTQVKQEQFSVHSFVAEWTASEQKNANETSKNCKSKQDSARFSAPKPESSTMSFLICPCSNNENVRRRKKRNFFFHNRANKAIESTPENLWMKWQAFYYLSNGKLNWK